MKICYCIGGENCRDTSCQIVKDWLKKHSHLKVKKHQDTEWLDLDKNKSATTTRSNL